MQKVSVKFPVSDQMNGQRTIWTMMHLIECLQIPPNRIRLRRAAETLRRRHDEAATVGNWEVAGEMLRALHEVESLMDIF